VEGRPKTPWVWAPPGPTTPIPVMATCLVNVGLHRLVIDWLSGGDVRSDVKRGAL
jgi:hypothetical protein